MGEKEKEMKRERVGGRAQERGVMRMEEKNGGKRIN